MYVVTGWLMPLVRSRYGVVATIVSCEGSVYAPAPRVQSANVIGIACVVPSVYVTVRVPVAPVLAPSMALPRRPIVVVPAGKLTGTTCPADQMLSSVPGCSFGQV